jgi:hypothetical protein
MSDPQASGGGEQLEAVATTPGYRELIERLQRRIRESQARAARTLNRELVMLYWSLGRDILVAQEAGGWGDDIVGWIAEDLRADTGSARGFSRRNLFYMRRFAALWPGSRDSAATGCTIGCRHHHVLVDAFARSTGRPRTLLDGGPGNSQMMAATTSVSLKSSPLKSSGLPVTVARA